MLGLAQDRGPHVGGLPQHLLGSAGDVLADERGQRVLGLRADRLGHAGGDEVHDGDRGSVAVGQRIGEPQGQLGVRPAADRNEDPADLVGPALLDDGDVAGQFADDLVDGGRDHRPARVLAGRGLAAPAEDHQVRFLLGGGLDDARGGVAADPDQRMDDGALGHVVEHLLEQAPGLARSRRTVAQGHPLGDLDDAQRGQLAGPLIHQRRTDADQLLGGERVGDRDQDPCGEGLGAHELAAPSLSADGSSRACQRSTR